MSSILTRLFLLISLTTALSACASKRAALDDFAESQEKKLAETSTYREGVFNFWVSVYEPSLDDVYQLKDAWRTSGGAFPESRSIGKVVRAVKDPNKHVVLVSLFMTRYELADLSDKALGWTVSPKPSRIEELDEYDVPLRSFMPVQNEWARYFILEYPIDQWTEQSKVIVGNRGGIAELSLKR